MIKILLTIEIPKFAREITVSQKQRPKYFEKKGKEEPKLPKKYQTHDYAWSLLGKKLVLHNTITKEPVIKNPTVAGTPKTKIIKGNDVWGGHLNESQLNLYKRSISGYFWEIIKHSLGNSQSIIDDYRTDILCNLPIKIKFDFHTYKEEQDIDNLDLFYRKAFLDGIQDQYKIEKGKPIQLIEKRLIPNDNTNYIKSITTDHNDCFINEDKLIITLESCINKKIDYTKEEILKLNFNK